MILVSYGSVSFAGTPARAGALHQLQTRRCVMPDIRNAKVAILATYGFEQSELLVPQQKLKDAGATVVVVSPEGGQIRGWKHKDWGDSVTVDKTLDEVSPDEFDAIVLP